MSNIGKLTTPSGEGASITIDNDIIKVTKNIVFDNNTLIGYTEDWPNELYLSANIDVRETESPTALGNSAFIALRNNNYTGAEGPGSFTIGLRTPATSERDSVYRTLQATTDSEELTWHYKPIETVYDIDDSYIKYSNGLLIQWLFSSSTGTDAVTVTFPIAFKTNEYRCIGVDTGSARYPIGIKKQSTSSVLVYGGEGTWGIDIIAIGRWR